MGEKEVEDVRDRLSRNPRFRVNDAFERLDINSHGYIDK